MCRWLAYSGSPVRIEDLLYRPQHSLIDQSLHSRLGAETTNGDGFGIGWYGVGDTPGVFHSVDPHGTIATCANWRGTSSRHSYSRTSARHRAPRSSRRTATRSATDRGYGCTTVFCATSHV